MIARKGDHQEGGLTFSILLIVANFIMLNQEKTDGLHEFLRCRDEFMQPARPLCQFLAQGNVPWPAIAAAARGNGIMFPASLGTMENHFCASAGRTSS